MPTTSTAKYLFSTSLAGTTLRVAGLPGLPGGAGLDGPTLLAARLIQPTPGEQVALFGCGHAALGVVLARRLGNGSLTLNDPHLVALQASHLTLAANEVANAVVSETISLLPEGAAAYDRVIVLIPPMRALGRRWLVEAQALLRPGGRLELAGANRDGIQPLIADAAALFGSTQILGYGGGCRVASTIQTVNPPPPPAWARAGGITPGSWHHVNTTLPGGPIDLCSLPGVFSYDRLDPGTALLLTQLGPADGLRVLDAGCGYGPLGLAAARSGAAHVDLLDVNLLAVAAAQENCRRLGLARTRTMPGDRLEAVAGERYDLVLCNPPFHRGREVDLSTAFALATAARPLLKPGGQLLLVANRFLPYARELAPSFAQIDTLAADRAYQVLSCRR